MTDSTLTCLSQSDGTTKFIINVGIGSPNNWGVQVTSQVDWGRGGPYPGDCPYFVENFYGSGTQTNIIKDYRARPGSYCAVLAPINTSGGEDFCTFTVSGGGGGGNNYGCTPQGACQAGYGNLPAGCNNTCTTSNTYGCSQGQCTPGAGSLPPGCNNTCSTSNTYGCNLGQCQQGYGTLPAGCNNTCTGATSPGCPGCDLTQNMCLDFVGLGCKPKMYVYGAVALVFFMMMMKKG